MAQAGLGKRLPGRTGSMQGHGGRLRHAVRDFDIEVGAWDFSCYRGALANAYPGVRQIYSLFSTGIFFREKVGMASVQNGL